MKKILLISLFISLSFNALSQEKFDAEKICKDLYLNPDNEFVYNKYIGGEVSLNGKFEPVDDDGLFYYVVRKIIKDGNTKTMPPYVSSFKANIDRIKIYLVAEKEMSKDEANIYMKMENQPKNLSINNIGSITSETQYDMVTEVLTLACTINGNLVELTD